jgi:hypothetical protein
MSKDIQSPWYREFAANDMANLNYRIMTLSERGLLFSIKNECWVNDRVPENTELLSKVLGFPEKEIKLSLPGIMCFFAVSDGFIYHPELKNYKEELEVNKTKQKGWGKIGAEITNGKRKKRKSRIDTADDGHPAGTPSDTPQVPRRSKRGVLSYINSNSIKSNSVFRKEKVKDDFVDGMESYESAQKEEGNILDRIGAAASGSSNAWEVE